VEGKMYILSDFSLKTTLTLKFFGWPAQQDSEKTSPRLNISTNVLVFHIFTKT
jgi:hypothetical protein